MSTDYFPYFNVEKKIIGPKDILVTNSALMEDPKNEKFFGMDRKNRIANLKDYKETAFRNPVDLTPCYDRMGNHMAPAAYEDPEKEELYDVFFDASTMELLPDTVFQCQHAQIRFLGAPGAGKDVKAVAALPILDVMQKYYEGLTYNVDYQPLCVQDVKELYERITEYYDGKVPDKTVPDTEVIPLPIRLDYQGKTLLLEMVAEAGEDLMKLQWKDQLFKNPYCITVFTMSAKDYIDLAKGISSPAFNSSMQILRRFKKLGLRMGGLANEHHRFVFILNQSDLLSELKNARIKELLEHPTMTRKKDGELEIINGGTFDLDEFKEFEEKIYAAIKETNPALYSELIDIGRYMDVNVLVTADLNEKAENNHFDSNKYIPYRTDEFWKYMLYVNGLIKGTTEKNIYERSVPTFPLKYMMDRAGLLLKDDECDEDTFEESELVPRENAREKFARFLKGVV